MTDQSRSTISLTYQSTSFYIYSILSNLNEHFKDSKEIPDVQFNSPDDVITNDFPLFRPPEMENTGYKEIEDYVDYDMYGMIGARSKKLPNGDKDWFTINLPSIVELTGQLCMQNN